MEKFQATRYMLLSLCDWYYEMNPSLKEGDSNDFSILKILKLVFLLAPINYQNRTLLDEGFSFEAWPYGPVERELYFHKDELQLNESGKKVNYKALKEVVAQDGLLHQNKSFLDGIVKELKKKNRHLINLTASQLVDLTHLYSSWISNYDGTKNKEIPNNQILEEEKFYFIIDF